MNNTEENQATTVFREYLQIRSVQPDPDYDGIVKFLQNYAKTNSLQCRVFEAAPNRPIVIITIEGTDPSLPSILLNSHTDVVPVFPKCWKYEPFSATKTENGDIYARGSQDMKCVGIQHLEALKELCSEGVRFLRTVHVSFIPDEEIGGKLGMKIWVDTDDFKSLNVGFALDEGLANPGERMRVFYSERIVRWGSFVAKGNPGHGSSFLEGTAGPKVYNVMGKILEFRDQQEASNMVKTEGGEDVVGGVQHNVVPDELEVGFDLRAAPVSMDEVDKMLDEWCAECDVSLKYSHKQSEFGLTSTDPEDKWWKAFSGALDKRDVKYTKEIFPAGTDSRYLRNIGIPALGFSPMNRTPILLHDHNEYLNEKVFLDGIQIFKSIIEGVANVQG